MSEEMRQTESSLAGLPWYWRTAIKVVIVVVAVLILAAIGMIEPPDRTVEPNEAPPVNVKVVEVVSERDFADSFVLPAVIEPNQVVTISAEVAARVELIGPGEGDPVNAGDLLIELNDELIRPQFDRAEAQVGRDQIEFERMASLFNENATSRQDLDNATTSLAASQAQLAEVRARLERTEIHTPLTGVLNDLRVEEGEYVGDGTPVAEIVDMAVVKVVVDVPERDVAFFAVGQAAEVVLENKGRERAAQGTITYINALANPETRSTAMEITLDNRDRLLRSGQIVRVRLTRRTLNDAILIPLLAVIPQEEGYSVYVVEDSLAEQRAVVLGIIRGDRVQIVQGLSAGETLIIDGHRLVAPDQKVNIVPGND
ncbi:MAG: efflux RND transporter periplasmic adaptor subunit [Phycisphaerales bacterium]|nr:MAG: efflux RND transporter periplasmic adaptor subunit [Phycisphaerales bacterium]